MRGHLPKSYGIILGLRLFVELAFCFSHFSQHSFDVGLAARRCFERFECGLNESKKVTFFSVLNNSTRNSTSYPEENFVKLRMKCRRASFGVGPLFGSSARTNSAAAFNFWGSVLSTDAKIWGSDLESLLQAFSNIPAWVCLLTA